MGRWIEGATRRERRVIFRLNHEEGVELDEKCAARSLNVSDYFRTLMKEDDHGAQR